MPIEGFECKLAKVESLEKWFEKEEGEDGQCRPCRLQPLASLYVGVLERAGETNEAQKLTEVFDSQDILKIARTMDTIRAGAKEPVRKDLEDLDCLAQSYKEGDD